MISPLFSPRCRYTPTCSEYGIKAIIQPGGSLNDNSVIKEAKKQNINLVFTGIRHFKH